MSKNIFLKDRERLSTVSSPLFQVEQVYTSLYKAICLKLDHCSVRDCPHLPSQQCSFCKYRCTCNTMPPHSPHLQFHYNKYTMCFSSAQSVRYRYTFSINTSRGEVHGHFQHKHYNSTSGTSTPSL